MYILCSTKKFTKFKQLVKNHGNLLLYQDVRTQHTRFDESVTHTIILSKTCSSILVNY